MSSDALPGVETFDIDLKEQKVSVKGDVKPDDVLEKVSKTGKPPEFWPAATAKTELPECIKLSNWVILPDWVNSR